MHTSDTLFTFVLKCECLMRWKDVGFKYWTAVKPTGGVLRIGKIQCLRTQIKESGEFGSNVLLCRVFTEWPWASPYRPNVLGLSCTCDKPP
jgi:hypothetical protein